MYVGMNNKFVKMFLGLGATFDGILMFSFSLETNN